MSARYCLVHDDGRVAVGPTSHRVCQNALLYRQCVEHVPADGWHVRTEGTTRVLTAKAARRQNGGAA